MRLQETEDQWNNHLQHHQQRRQHRQNCGLQVDESNKASTRRLTLSCYVAYHIQYHLHEFNTLLHSGRLFTHYVVDMFASVDQQRLCWIEMNQPLFRAAQFNNPEDVAADDPDNLDLNEIGQ